MRRNHGFRFLALTGTILALAGFSTPLRAQDPDDMKRGVARISLMNGDVNVRRGDSGEWVAGVINAPLLTDDRIATGPGSRAEVQFDANNVLRLGANSEVHLAQLEYNRYQVEVARGIATFRNLRTNDANIEIDTPSVSVRPSRQGSFRIAVNEGGETEVTARGGDVEVFTPRGSQWIRNGQMMMARGAASDPEFQVANAGGPDDWDRWCDSRDRAMLQSNSYRYVGQGVYGAEDLDNYGSWESVPEYGNVWRPTVAADWAPYHYGRWSWADYYGWTWVSYDPWGWAPYHYGRWFHNDRFGWCWYPGAIGVRHYWSPALVGWFGFGGGGGLGFGFGNVGWVPLAPYEVFHPWWGGRGGYGGFNRQVNITNVNVTNVYRNARYNGVSGVGYRDFANGHFNNVTRFNGSQIREAGLIQGRTPFTPTAQHMQFSNRAVGNVPRGNENTRFFRQQTPNPVQHMPMGQGQMGRTEMGRPEMGRQGIPGNVNAAPQQQNGWRRFGTPSGGQMAPQNNGSMRPQQPMRNEQVAPRQENRMPENRMPVNRMPENRMPENRMQDNRGGWQRFGSPGSNAPQAPRQENRSAPRQEYQAPQRNDYGRQFGNGGSNRPENLRIAPPVVRERPNQNYAPPQRQESPRYNPPAYSAPRQESPRYSSPGYNRQSAPSYSAPRSAPSYSAPRQSAPSNSAPRGNSGGGGDGHSNGGGGGNHGRR